MQGQKNGLAPSSGVGAARKLVDDTSCKQHGDLDDARKPAPWPNEP
jgi:hypothetical protein